nr:hypothetical protein [Deltaproteobacteria bacterium]
LLWETGVRAIRADYCGNGIAYTQTGTPIHLSNPSAGLSFLASAGATEAVFGPDGALCLTSPRVIASPMDLPCALSKCDDVGGAPALITTPYHTWTKIQPSLPDTF